MRTVLSVKMKIDLTSMLTIAKNTSAIVYRNIKVNKGVKSLVWDAELELTFLVRDCNSADRIRILLKNTNKEIPKARAPAKSKADTTQM
jgi:hypothetical protein